MSRAAFLSVYFLLTTYVGRYACKKQLLQGKIKAFIVTIGVVVVCFSLLLTFFLFISDLQRGWTSLTFGVPLVVLFFSLGVFLTSSTETFRKQLTAASVAEHQKQSELELLRSQLSPHFLFNTLNNLYGMTIGKDPQIALLIVKLSDLLRYSVYQTKRTFVSLQHELNYIQNYVELERIRLGERLELKTAVLSESAHQIEIPPLLLIVFVENAFKHSKNSFDSKVSINMSIETTANKLIFKISNSCGPEDSISDDLERNSGMGLANTIRRLDLLYGSNYKLRHSRLQDTYFVHLELKLKHVNTD